MQSQVRDDIDMKFVRRMEIEEKEKGRKENNAQPISMSQSADRSARHPCHAIHANQLNNSQNSVLPFLLSFIPCHPSFPWGSSLLIRSLSKKNGSMTSRQV